MAYDEGLAQRVREVLADEAGLTEKRMFGGIAFMLDGNMACGVSGDELMLRVGTDGFDALLSEPGVRIFDMSGRPMKGWLLVSAGATAEDDDLAGWVRRGVTFARSLPPK
ncbi:MAG: TfoX/Sxy family protein [Caldilineales bacterium]